MDVAPPVDVGERKDNRPEDRGNERLVFEAIRERVPEDVVDRAARQILHQNIHRLARNKGAVIRNNIGVLIARPNCNLGVQIVDIIRRVIEVNELHGDNLLIRKTSSFIDG